MQYNQVARLRGPILPWVHKGNFSPVPEMKKAIRGQAKFGHVKRQTMQLQTADLADGGFFKKIHVIFIYDFYHYFLI